MITLYLEKLYRYPRMGEHLSVAVPFKQGQLTDVNTVRVYDKTKPLPTQCKTTAKYKDGSVKYLFVRFIGDLPGNSGKEFQLDWTDADNEKTDTENAFIELKTLEDGFGVVNGYAHFQVKNHSRRLVEYYFDGRQHYGKNRFEGPYLELRRGEEILPVCDMVFGKWEVAEQGPICVILKNRGLHKTDDGREITFEVKITVWSGKSWIEVSYRLINTSLEELQIGALGFYCKAKDDSTVTSELGESGNITNITGTSGLEEVEKLYPIEECRFCTGYSNYKTKFSISGADEPVVDCITADRLLLESNEHAPEVLYGTFFADRTDKRGGICATIYQAQQNYPKAVRADKDKIAVMLVPRGDDCVVMQPGMSREQRFLLHFHSSEESLAQLDNRSLIYQMPDRPVISPQVFKEAGVMPDIFPDKMNKDTELLLVRRADGHNRGFGMMNWGDSVDNHYTNQGRGGGKTVWSNNEYDYPHACALMYARTGVRRFLDYMLVSASHWQDVDVCHYSDNPLALGAQYEHTRGHVINGKIMPSHEWVEGLLDYYHFTGDERALETAIGIGENVMRQLELPAFAKAGEMSARETGWALRTFTALYVETGDERWLEKGEWIVSHFRQWEEDYGHWLSPYTDNTLIRVPFMIAVAVGSLVRYYRVRPSGELRDMIVRAVDDLVENGMLENGLFYYKELPSLTRLGTNPLVLEAMAIGYELTKEEKYLEAGRETFLQMLKETGSKGGQKVHIDDAVILGGDSTKPFGQGFIPLATFDRALDKAGLEDWRKL
ncbi:MAG: glycoside hydrolase family 127 protein [Lachnospiraceae bacterium]|nr:glycoside hydrolase family 127 protein [Lachnospiraceae bacterium]